MPAQFRNTPETILVVDDDESVLKVVVAVLKNARFTVLSATDGPKAIELAGKHDGLIMLMSGGANGNLLVLNYGWAFIQKPFVGTKLIEMVTHVLHSADRSQPGGQEFDSRKDVVKNPET